MQDFLNSKAYYWVLAILIIIALFVGYSRSTIDLLEIALPSEEVNDDSVMESSGSENGALSTVNLIENPSFESDPAGTFTSVGSENNEWTNEEARTGEYSIKLVGLDPEATSAFSGWFVEAPAGTLKNSHEYTLTAWYKASEEVLPEDVMLEIALFDAYGEYFVTYNEEIFPSDDWVKIEETFLTKDVATGVRIQFVQKTGNATVYVDDMSLVEKGPLEVN